jgi:hypothetical protein
MTALPASRVAELWNVCDAQDASAVDFQDLRALAEFWMTRNGKLGEQQADAIEAGARALEYENRTAILDDKMRARNMERAAVLRSLGAARPAPNVPCWVHPQNESVHCLECTPGPVSAPQNNQESP